MVAVVRRAFSTALLVGLVVAGVAAGPAGGADQPDDVLIYVSSTTGGSVDGINFKDEDILVFDTSTDTWSLFFDGSDVGLAKTDIDAVYVFDDRNDATLDDILISLAAGRKLGGFWVDDSDIVRFNPTSLGPSTAGTWSRYFDGSDVGLNKNTEDVDAFTLAEDGRLLISTLGPHKVPRPGGGVLRGADEDIIAFTPTSLGANTSGSYARYFDGSDVNLTRWSEDIWGTHVDPRTGDIFMTFLGNYLTQGLSGNDEDIVRFEPTSLGWNTAGSFSKYWDGGQHGFGAEKMDAIAIEPINLPPEANDDDYTTDEDTVLVGALAGVLTNDFDVDGDPLTVTAVNGSAADVGVTITLPSGAELTQNAGGDFVYDPNGQFEALNDGESATDSYTYEVSDGAGGTDTATVTITIDGITDVGTIVIEKVTIPAGGTGFTFSDDIVAPNSLSLDDGQSQTFSNVPVGTYTVTEGDPAPTHELAQISCDDGGSALPSTGDLPSRTATIGLESGETVTCTFTNSLVLASVGDRVWNDLDADGLQDSGEPGIGGVTVTLWTADAGGNPIGVVATTTTDSSGNYLFLDLPPDTYVLQFEALAGFVYSAKDVGADDTIDSDVNPGTGITDAVVLGPGDANLDVDAGYVETGTVRITKLTSPAGGSGFGFTDNIDAPGAFTLDHGATRVFLQVSPGPYSVTEDDPAPTYALTSLVCDDGGSVTPSTGDLGSRTATVNVDPGETVECTFTNTLLNVAPDVNLDLDNSAGASPDYVTTFTEDAGPVAVTDSDLQIVDPDDVNLASASVTLTNGQDGGDEQLQTGACAGLTVVGAGTSTVTISGTASIAAYEACLSSVTYENTSDDPTDSPDRVIQIVVGDGTDNSDARFTTVDVVPVNDAPEVVGAPSYEVVGNVSIDVPFAAGLLDSLTITDPDGPGPITIGTPTPTSSVNGGDVSINPTTGAFTYDPPAGYEGSDTFQYDICDGDGACTPVTATLSIGDMIWFIDASAGGGGDGRLSAPFDSLTGFGSAADDPGDVIYLADGAYSGGFALLTDQILVGDGSSASVASVAGITLPTHSVALPTLSGTDPVLTSSGDAISLGVSNTIRGLTIGNTTGTGVDGAGVGDLSISEVTINGSGKAVDINGAGTVAITFDSVTVTSSTTGGIRLSSAAGTTTFGSVDVTTTSGTGISLSNAGAVNINGTTNTVSSASGTALSATNTTIGGSGWTFQSISSTGGSGTGIVLDTTGSGSFTIEGTGVAGSGGTISNKTGADGATTSGNGIYLNQTGPVSLSRMQLNGHQNFAIRGTDVSGFSLLNSTIDGSNGTSAGADEGSVSFDNLTGTALFDNSTIEGGLEDNIVITNTAGSLDLDVLNSTIGLNSMTLGNDGLLVETSGTAALDLLVEDSDFLGARGDMLQTNALGTSTQAIVIRDNDFTNAHPSIVSGGGGITLSGGSAASTINVTYTVEGTTLGDQVFTGAEGSAITANFVNGAGTVNGTISSNQIGATGNAGSGSAGGSGIAVGAAGSLTHTVSILDNNVDQVAGFAGVDLLANGTSTLNATVTGNTLDEFSGFALAGVYTMTGGDLGSANMCVDLATNSIDASGSLGFDTYIDHLGSGAAYNFPGYGGGPVPGASPNALDAFLAAQNTLTGGSQDSSLAINVGGIGATCP